MGLVFFLRFYLFDRERVQPGGAAEGEGEQALC